jgi:hypothetical protein
LEARRVGGLPLSSDQTARRDDLASRDEATLTPDERTALALLRSHRDDPSDASGARVDQLLANPWTAAEDDEPARLNPELFDARPTSGRESLAPGEVARRNSLRAREANLTAEERTELDALQMRAPVAQASTVLTATEEQRLSALHEQPVRSDAEELEMSGLAARV